MNIRRLGFVIILIYTWVMMILLGSIMLETFMVYPNIFYNPPQSLELGMQFMAVAAPHDYFPPLGLISWVAGAASLLVGWRVKSARYWILGSLLMIVGEGLASMAFFWPRNTIMFIEGLAVHSPEFLRQTAQEFERLHWLRVGFNVAGSAMIFTGFLQYYRHLIVSSLARPHAGSDQARGVTPDGDQVTKSVAPIHAMSRLRWQGVFMIALLALSLAACGGDSDRSDDKAPTGAPVEASSTEALGSELFEKLDCIHCHQMNGAGPGPSLAGLYGASVPLESGESVTVDEEYIRTSILDPHAATHAGYPPIMPEFAGRIDEDELDALVAYIRSLEG